MPVPSAPRTRSGGAALCAPCAQVSCDAVTELDLSHNDFTIDGLEALGRALKLGALSGLQTLNLSNCTLLRALPEALGELHELQTLRLEGCVGLKSLPSSLHSLGGLRKLYALNCHGLNDALAALPRSVEVIRTNEK